MIGDISPIVNRVSLDFIERPSLVTLSLPTSPFVTIADAESSIRSFVIRIELSPS